MVYIKIPFFLFNWHFQGVVKLDMDGPSAQTLPLPGVTETLKNKLIINYKLFLSPMQHL